MTAYLLYRGLDNQIQRYSTIELSDERFEALLVPVSGAEQTLDALSLRLTGDVCAGRL